MFSMRLGTRCVLSLIFTFFCITGGVTDAEDYDRDADLELDDFAYWDACMTGPDGEPLDARCAVFDFDGDGAVDLQDFADFQVGFTGPAPPSRERMGPNTDQERAPGPQPQTIAPPPVPWPCHFGRKYAQAKKNDSPTGCSAKITTRNTTLCGEPNTTSIAYSIAYVGVTKFVGTTPEKWAQMGYQRFRGRGSTTIQIRRYAETIWGPGPSGRELHIEPSVPSGTHEYKCYLLSSLFGQWKYEYDGLPFHTAPDRPEWRNVTGTAYQWTAEILNKEDQMVGTETAKCHFTECKYAVGWGAFQSANITGQDLFTSDLIQWVVIGESPTAIDVWDRFP